MVLFVFINVKSIRSKTPKIRSELGERRIDVVLSDMAPNVSGNYSLDHEAIIHLVFTVIKFRYYYAKI